jgi:pyruvate/2-oxoglutarate dehydrogenase complex dihydrolipoamide acyltransferase (E2) component
MADLPNLAGVATKDLVESIGTGRFSASYINWSRTMNLLRQNAPGWMVDYEPNAEGELLHRAPVGGYLMIRFRHVDGTVTPALPQAVMDHKNNSIPYDKIAARDITDTQRRGMCMAAAMTFGLAYELWAKIALESGYGAEEPREAPKAAPKAQPAAAKAEAPAEASEASFREAALAKGVDTRAIDAIVAKLGGKWEAGLKTLAAKSAEELNAKYAPADDAGEQW